MTRYKVGCYIADLGLCRAIDEVNNSKIYGILPYIAPEVLRGQPYTQKADVYSFGVIAYELFSNAYPYYSDLDDINFALEVCQGLRPNIDKLKIPQLLKDLIKNCWNSCSEQRLTASQLEELLWYWKEDTSREEKEDIVFYHQLKEIEEEYNNFSQNTPYKTHLIDSLVGKMIDTNEINSRLSKNFESLRITDSIDKDNWKNLYYKLTKEQNLNFTYNQCKDWIKY